MSSKKLNWDILKDRNVDEIKSSLNNINEAFDSAIRMLEESNDQLRESSQKRKSLSSAFNSSYDIFLENQKFNNDPAMLAELIETLVSNINISREEIIRISQKLFDIKQHILDLESKGISATAYINQRDNIESKLKFLIKRREDQLDGLASLRKLYKNNENK